MKCIFALILMLSIASGGLAGCRSVKTEGSAKKAEELLKSGAAHDMAEAQRMADNYNWLEAANQKEETARQERQKAADKK